eukprot:Rmarinus@m.18408
MFRCISLEILWILYFFIFVAGEKSWYSCDLRPYSDHCVFRNVMYYNNSFLIPGEGEDFQLSLTWKGLADYVIPIRHIPGEYDASQCAATIRGVTFFHLPFFCHVYGHLHELNLLPVFVNLELYAPHSSLPGVFLESSVDMRTKACPDFLYTTLRHQMEVVHTSTFENFPGPVCLPKVVAGLPTRYNSELPVWDSGWDESAAWVRRYSNRLAARMSLKHVSPPWPESGKMKVLLVKRSKRGLHPKELLTHAAKALQFDVEAVDFGEFDTINHQAAVVRGTNILVGIHGSGLGNTLFLPHHNSALVQLYPYGVERLCDPPSQKRFGNIQCYGDSYRHFALSLGAAYATWACRDRQCTSLSKEERLVWDKCIDSRSAVECNSLWTMIGRAQDTTMPVLQFMDVLLEAAGRLRWQSQYRTCARMASVTIKDIMDADQLVANRTHENCFGENCEDRYGFGDKENEDRSLRWDPASDEAKAAEVRREKFQRTMRIRIKEGAHLTPENSDCNSGYNNNIANDTDGASTRAATCPGTLLDGDLDSHVPSTCHWHFAENLSEFVHVDDRDVILKMLHEYNVIAKGHSGYRFILDEQSSKGRDFYWQMGMDPPSDEPLWNLISGLRMSMVQRAEEALSRDHMEEVDFVVRGLQAYSATLQLPLQAN